MFAWPRQVISFMIKLHVNTLAHPTLVLKPGSIIFYFVTAHLKNNKNWLQARLSDPATNCQLPSNTASKWLLYTVALSLVELALQYKHKATGPVWVQVGAGHSLRCPGT